MKGAITLAIYIAIAIGITGAAFGQSKPTPDVIKYATSPVPISTNRTVPVTHSPITPPPTSERAPDTVVIKYGQGGRVDEHQARYAYYKRTGTKVEVRGPCYSACTLLLTYVEPENLCIAAGAFMAFHAVRGLDRGAYMENETFQYYLNLPRPIRLWINANGSWQALPLDGYWTMYDRELWAMGYPKCR